MLCAGVYFGAPKLTISFLLAAALHELGHLLVAKFLGMKVRRLTLSCAGAELVLDTHSSYAEDVILCLTGPAINLLLALWSNYPFFTGANLLLGIFNLFPIRGLDGGNALYAFLAWALGPVLGERITKRVSILFSIAITLTGGGIFFYMKSSPRLMLMGVWLTAVALGRRK